MASLNPSTDISAFIGTVFEGAILAAYENSVVSGLVRVFNDRTGLATRQNQQYGGATMNTIGETDDLVGQAFTPSAISTLTPAEAGAQYFLTDSRIETDPFNVARDASLDLGLAIANKMETDLIANFDNLTAGTVGTASGTISWSNVMAAESILRDNLAPYPYYLVLHPFQWYELAKAASVASSSATNAADMLKDEVNRMFFVKQFGGVSIFVSANVDNSTTTSTYGAMFSRDAIALDMRRQPRLEPDRDPSRRGYELNMTAVYAHGVWRPTWGVAMLSSAAKPTS